MRDRSTSRRKGDLLESLVAQLHLGPGVEVQRNVRLKGRSRESREIDVLLTSQVAGYQVKIAVECKNRSSKVGVQQIDAFVGKLQDVGLPVNLAIYVSTCGYTRGAIRQAVECGIRPLELEGLNSDRLRSAAERAFQFVVYMLLHVGGLYKSGVSGGMMPSDYFHYRDSSGAERNILTTVWWRWLRGEVPMKGEHLRLEFEHPPDSTLGDRAAPDVPLTTCVTYEIRFVVFSKEGSFYRHRLRHAASGKVEKTRFGMVFPEPAANAQVHEFGTQSALEEHLSTFEEPRLTLGPIRVPRIMWSSVYWPPSNESLERVREILAQGRKPSFEEVEGLDLDRAWEGMLAPGSQAAIDAFVDKTSSFRFWPPVSGA